MATTQYFSSLVCELKIIEAKNIESKLKGNLFVRFYLPSGTSNHNTSIRLNTKEISTKHDHVWNESFSLACNGIGNSMDLTYLNQESLVLELRLRNKVPVFGATFGATRLLGKGEIPLKEVLESPNMAFDKWVNLVSTCGHDQLDGVKLPKLKVEMRVEVNFENEMKMVSRRILGKKYWKECGCKDGHDHGCSYDDYDVFALAAAVEAL